MDGPIWTKFRSLMLSDMLNTVMRSKSKLEVELQHGGPLLFQTGSSYISAVDSDTSTKFGLLIDIDLLKRGISAASSLLYTGCG